MHTRRFYGLFKAIAAVVLVLGVIAIIYAAVIGVSYWKGIGV